MTREEREQAISEFNSFKEHGYNHGYLPSSWSIEMAIQALEQITKIADIVDGTIDHFDYDDAMDVLYEIKGVVK